MQKTTQILRLHQVIDRTGLKKSTIYLRMKSKEFPQRRKISVRAVGWLEDEIEEYLRRIR
ncbi:MAG TPA: AlpA family phage regulatory protein [Rhodanobacter sp.]|nr:AlpA family phage regulatory protein [Rhodanobacter sp.]